MNDKSKFVIFMLVIMGLACFAYLMIPSVDVVDFSVEKHKETTKYESGKIEKDYYIDYGFNLETRAIDYISGEINIYDNRGNLIYCESFDVDTSSSDFDYTLNVDKSTYKKIDTAELILYNSDYTEQLCYNTTDTIKKGQNIKDYVDDVEEYTPKTTTTSTSSSSSYDYDSSSSYDSYSSDSDYSVYGDYVGNSNTHKFHESFCSWADNIKSGNILKILLIIRYLFRFN